MEEYKELAEKFTQSYQMKSPYASGDIIHEHEVEFWRHVEEPSCKLQQWSWSVDEKYDLSVEYAADLPSKKYGSAFPTKFRGRLTDTHDPDDMKSHPFNLNNISQAKNSLFQIISTKNDSISGITSPWVYSGMLFASFCWHVEDLNMSSVNYMHQGAPKTW